MEKEYSVLVRSCDDTCPRMAEFNSTVVTWCYKVRIYSDTSHGCVLFGMKFFMTDTKLLSKYSHVFLSVVLKEIPR